MKTKYLRIFQLLGLGIIFICVFYYIFVSFIIKDDPAKSAFGDTFGGLNALFSGLAFAGLIVTLLIQYEELKITRNEFAKSAIAQDESQKALHAQHQSMNLSLQMDSLSKYINNADKHAKRYHLEVAREILFHITEKSFGSPEYDGIMKPNIECLSTPLYSKNIVELEFRNSGIAMSFPEVGYPWEMKDKPDSRKVLEHGDRFVVRNRSSTGYQERIYIALQGIAVPNKYTVIFKIFESKGAFVLDIYSVRLSERIV